VIYRQQLDLVSSITVPRQLLLHCPTTVHPQKNRGKKQGKKTGGREQLFLI